MNIINTFKPQPITYLPEWLENASNGALETDQISTLILNEIIGGGYAIITWGIDENALQQFVYCATNKRPSDFISYSDRGMIP